MRDAIAAAGLVSAAVFVCAARPPPDPMPPARSGAGRCVITVGDAERPCTAVRISGDVEHVQITVDAPGGGIVMRGPISGELGDVSVNTIDYGAARGAPTRIGVCQYRYTQDMTGLELINCEIVSAFGQIRVRFDAAGGDPRKMSVVERAAGTTVWRGLFFRACEEFGNGLART